METRPDTRRTQAQADGRPSLERRPKPDASPDIGRDGRKADTSRTKLQTQGGHMVDKVWKRGQSGLKPDTGTRWTHGGQVAEADKLWGRGQPFFPLREKPAVNGLGNKWRTLTSGGQGLEVWPKPTTQGGHMADKLGRRGQSQQHKADKDWRRGQTRQHKADKRRTHGGKVADKDWRRGQSQKGGQVADTRRASGGQGLEARPKPTTQGGQVADKDWRRGQSQQHKADKRGHKADKRRTRTAEANNTRRTSDKWRTRTGGAAKANNTRRTSGGHKAKDKDWRRGHSQQRKADKWRTHGGQAPETRPKPTTQGGQAPETRPKPTTQGGQVADTSRTHGGQAPETRPEHIVASLFFPKREPHSKLFGEKQEKKGQGEMKDRVESAAKLQGRQEHCRLKVARRPAGKGANTTTSTKADNNGHREKTRSGHMADTEGNMGDTTL